MIRLQLMFVFALALGPLKALADWPCWSGPQGNFSAADSGTPLISDLSQAKLLWESEEIVPVCKAYAAASSANSGGRHRKNQKGLPSGGGASPVVVGGKVFLTYFVPAGDVYAEKLSARMTEEPKYARLIEADIVFLAIDAATGKTAWKRVFPREGLNIQNAKSCSYSGLTPCVADGRVFGISTSLKLHALRADTGEPIWEAPIPGEFEDVQAVKKQSLTSKSMPKDDTLDKRVGGSLVCVDGAVIVPLKGAWYALDAETGKPLWTLKEVSGTAATPAWWTSDSQTFLIAADQKDGSVRCIEPRTGKVVWTEEKIGPNHNTVVVSGDVLIAKSHLLTVPDKKDPTQTKPSVHGELAAYRLSATGAKHLWSLPSDKYKWDEQTPAIAAGHIYAQLLPAAGGKPIFACVELETGKMLGVHEGVSGGGGDACMTVADGRVIVSGDASHVRNNFSLFSADGAQTKPLGASWIPPNPPTTAYHPALSFPIVNGQLFLRGADGIYCYDLRQSSAASP